MIPLREGDDADREPDVDDEPSLAAPIENDQRLWTSFGDQDLEGDHSDCEPMLGAPERGEYFSQGAWAAGANGRRSDDCEEDAADGPEGDYEREHDEAERGIADEDGALEQGRLQFGISVE